MSRLMIQKIKISCVIISLMSCSSDVDLASCQSPSGDCNTGYIEIQIASYPQHILGKCILALLIYISLTVFVSQQHPCSLAFPLGKVVFTQYSYLFSLFKLNVVAYCGKQQAGKRVGSMASKGSFSYFAWLDSISISQITKHSIVLTLNPCLCVH